MIRKALVTGGAGFVGAQLAAELLSAGWAVTVIDDLSNSDGGNVPEGAVFLRGDLADPGTYSHIENERFDVIYHIAAQASNALSFRDPLLDLAANQVATLRLLEFARSAGIRRFVFTSSMSAYGNAQTFPTPETEPLRPLSPYAAHKSASEDYLRMYAAEEGLEPTVFRLYTTYGGGQNLDNLDQGLLSIYLAYLVRNEPIVVKGSLDRTRDIVHVSDVVRALVVAADSPQTIGKTYNLCSGTTRSIRQLIDGLITAAGFDPGEYPVVVQDATPGDPMVTHGSLAAAEADFGFRPEVMPEEGIRMVVDAARQRGYLARRAASRD